VDHVVKPREDGRERIQAIEIMEKNGEYILLVYVFFEFLFAFLRSSFKSPPKII
jgi:hypothetical protein